MVTATGQELHFILFYTYVLFPFSLSTGSCQDNSEELAANQPTIDPLTLYRQHSGQPFLWVIGDLSSQTQKNNNITTAKENTTTKTPGRQ